MRRFSPFAATLLILCASVAARGGDCGEGWLPGQAFPGFNGYVSAMTNWDPDGPGPQSERLVVAGDFSIAANTLAKNIAAWDGEKWLPVGFGLLTDASSLTVYNGQLTVGGQFVASGGGMPMYHIGKWSATVGWQPIGSGIGTSLPGTTSIFVFPNVFAMAEFNGDLIAAGMLGSAGGISADGIARWDGQSWHALGEGVVNCTVELGCNQAVYALAVYDDELIVGGAFTTAGGLPVNGIARWNGAEWLPFGSGVSTQGKIQAMLIFDGDLIVGGSFVTIDGVLAANIARWDGRKWHSLGSGVTGTSVRALAVQDDELVVGGTFSAAGSVESPNLARWNGTQWLAFDQSIGPGVSSLGVHAGELFAGGSFTSAGGEGALHVARWNGLAWDVPAGGNGLDAWPNALLVHEGDLYAGGLFEQAGTSPADSIARWDGFEWHPLGSGIPGNVETLMSWNGDLIAGGQMGSAGGTLVKGVARWDGRSWSALGAGLSLQFQLGSVRELATFRGDLVASGSFSHSGGVWVSELAQWDGRTWGAVGGGVDGNVEDIVDFDGELIVGGSFHLYEGGDFNSLLAWDGASWHLLGPPPDQPISSLFVFEGDLIASGGFSMIGGIAANRAARWDGAQWHPMGLGPSSAISAFTAHGSELFGSGTFVIPGSPAKYVARWDGQLWTYPVDPVSGGSPTSVSAVATFQQELHLGGFFLLAGGATSTYWARWGLGCPASDLNHDGVVDGYDLALLLGSWSIPPGSAGCGGASTCTADLSGDGAVDAADVSILLGAWGPA